MSTQSSDIAPPPAAPGTAADAGLGRHPFRRLSRLLEPLAPPPTVPVLNLALGDPQHAAPSMIAEVLAAQAHQWNRYPPNVGTDAFREAVAAWLGRRFDLAPGLVDPATAILPVSGTREGLYLAAQLVVSRWRRSAPAVAFPNPFYPVYHGAAVMAGARPVPLDAGARTGFMPNVDALADDPALCRQLALLYLCNPANPQGSVAGRETLRRLVALARDHGFVLVVDECYSEIHDAAPPPSVLEVVDGALDNVLVFNSLSKRSNAAGLRAGFVAGDPAWIDAFADLRLYGSAGMPSPVQAAAAALWADERHVEVNRDRYRRKIDCAEARLGTGFGFRRPAGGFFLWLDVGDGVEAARRLWSGGGLRVLPGAYLSAVRPDGTTVADAYIRLALVHDEAVIADAMDRFAGVLANTPLPQRQVG